MQLVKSNDIISWLKRLDDLKEGSMSCVNFFKPFHLVTLGLTLKKAGAKTLSLPDNLTEYAARMKLWEAIDIDPPIAVNERSCSGRFLPIYKFDSTSKDINHLICDLVKIVFNTTSEQYVDSISTCIYEIINNFYDHANSTFPCLVMAQYWPRGDLVQIAIADMGIGIRESLDGNLNLSPRLFDCNACELASQFGITSKPNGGHSGYGLSLARELMLQVDGNFTLVSNHEIFMSKANEMISDNIHFPWNGTLLVMEWKKDSELDILEVYKGWELPEGFNCDDFL